MEKYFGSSTERSFVSNMGIFPLLFFRIICLQVDCDNDHSEKLADWTTPDDVPAAFPGVSLAVHYSRFHNREKNSKPARLKFHIPFPINFMTDAAAYSDMKKLVNTIFPYFDTQALDAARFFFGTTTAEVEIREGTLNLTELLQDADSFDQDMDDGQYGDRVISEGSRNATMSPTMCRSGKGTSRPQRAASSATTTSSSMGFTVVSFGQGFRDISPPSWRPTGRSAAATIP